MTNSPPALATLRMIVTAIIVGNCVLGGAVLFSTSRIGGRMFTDPAIEYILGGVAFLAIIGQAVVTPIFLMKPPRQADEKTLLKVFGTEVLLRIALLECAVALEYLFYLLTVDLVILIAGIVLVLLILFLRPTNSRYQRWRDRLT